MLYLLPDACYMRLPPLLVTLCRHAIITCHAATITLLRYFVAAISLRH